MCYLERRVTLFFWEKCICSKHQVLLCFNLRTLVQAPVLITLHKSCSVSHLLRHIKAPLHEHIQLDIHSIDHIHSDFHSADPRQPAFNCIILQCPQTFTIFVSNNLGLQTEGGS